MYGIELVKGKYKSKEISKGRGDKYRQIVSLLVRLIKLLYRMSKIVILDSSFCILKGIIKLKKLWVYVSTLIKERRF